jgi:hypothetical protein
MKLICTVKEWWNLDDKVDGAEDIQYRRKGIIGVYPNIDLTEFTVVYAYRHYEKVKPDAIIVVIDPHFK